MPATTLLRLADRHPLSKRLTYSFSRRLLERTAQQRYKLFSDFLNGKKILDVGVGGGSMSHLLVSQGKKVSGIDVVNTSLYEHITPVLYDGENIPFQDKSHDVATIICVLHHCTDQLRVLEEAMRVSKRVVIIEDTFRNSFERALVSARDCIGNWEFYDHPYRTTQDWRDVFTERGWKVTYSKEWSSIELYGMYGRQTLFVIDPV